jgi:hypothetical protein
MIKATIRNHFMQEEVTLEVFAPTSRHHNVSFGRKKQVQAFSFMSPI